MAPAIKAGSLVLTREQEEYGEGDIITFYQTKEREQTTTHRVHSVLRDDDIGKVEYETKGDANDTPDRGVVAANNVVGKVVFKLPYLGYPISFAKTGVGFVALVIVPAALIIYSELVSVKEEVSKNLKGKKSHGSKLKAKSEERKATANS
jgi:signal peptidase